MRFYHNGGAPVNYLVSIHSWNIDDLHYFAWKKEAQAFFDNYIKTAEAGVHVYMSDFKTGARISKHL